MCTYLEGKLIAFTGTLPPSTILEPAPVQAMVVSGEREKIHRDGQRHRTRRTCDRKAQYIDHDSHGVHGRKPRYKEHAIH